jgi:two-component system CheB/CheR fusion protein
MPMDEVLADPRASSDADVSGTRRTETPLRTVGIGASAGGLEALEHFFDHVPRDTGMAFVVIQHLSPDFKSIMDELLARHTRLPIHLVENAMLVEPDHVYLIPPKKEMIISGGRLLLSERGPQQELSLPIDVFFRSLAQDCGPRAVAVVLSGGGSDGSRGICDVHEAGGLVLVQDLESAQFDGMPRAARDAGVADFTLPPREMPKALLQHVAKNADPRAQTVADGVAMAEAGGGLAAVHRMLQEEFGLDFTHYKPSTITRRIERRLALAHSQNIDEYVDHLRRDRSELDVLYRDLLIGVTRFFRDEEAFDLLEHKVLPELLQRAPREMPLRFWVAGCATGEEAYSLAILLHDLIAKFGPRQVKIFATDVHRGSLEHAARGVYEEETVGAVPPDRLARYFLRVGSAYQVVPDLRQTIVFAQHNVIKDAPFTRVDLIACRNLLIYLQPPAQQKVLSFFHFALNRGGILFLGPSESTGPMARGFETVDKTWQLYRKQSDVRTPVDTRLQPMQYAESRVMTSAIPATGPRFSLSQLLGTYDALLDDVMPPSLLLSERGELVHAFAGASRFLRPHDGRQALNVLDFVGGELKMVISGGLKRALSEPEAVVFKGAHLGPNEVFKVTLRRVAPRGGGVNHVLVSFEPMEEKPRPPPASEIEIDLGQVSHVQLAALEGELSRTKESLQAAIEELEASNEELQASNEELQASNEELQSTNEELQSVNEELYTVNAEYQRKIGELTEMTNDMDNLLVSTEVGTIFLDTQLKIRKFTPQVAEGFSLMAHDLGRPIEAFAQNMEHPEIVDDLKRVLQTGQPIERELAEVRGKSFFLRIFPYRVKGTPSGVVLTLIDVSGLKAAEDALFHERYLLNSLLLSVPDAIYFKDARGRFIRANRAMAERLGLKDANEAEGKTAFELPDQKTALLLHNEDEAVVRSGEPQHYKLEKRQGTDGAEGWDLVTRLPLRDRTGRIVGVIVIFRNVTEQKHAEEKITEAIRRRDQFLAMLSHELRNPLGAIVTATSLLKTDSGRQKADRLLEILDRQSHQMARLLDDLLEASRVTQNKIELRKRLVDLRAVAVEATEAVRAQMDSLGIHFSTRISDERMCIHGDPVRLQQIQVNLLSNAAKYTHRGGHVVLEVAAENGVAVIRVRDDGAGIPHNMLDSVFELFVQSSRTLDRSAGGLGVGLTLVRALVAMHGGTVSAFSGGEGMGSEFVARIPLVAGDVEEEKAPISTSRRALPAGAKVVVVEDNADSREMLCELLQHAGFACRTAENGTEGLALIEALRPEIAILDVGLPGMNGYELARRLRGSPNCQNMWLLALTGYGQAQDRVLARDAGFDRHLVKPIDSGQLLKVLAEMSITEHPVGGPANDGVAPTL